MYDNDDDAVTNFHSSYYNGPGTHHVESSIITYHEFTY